GVLAGAWWLLEGDFEADAEQPSADHHGLSHDDAAQAAAAAHEAEAPSVDKADPSVAHEGEHEAAPSHDPAEPEAEPEAVPEPVPEP
ncbi:hypothetical protein ABTM06_20000, partial [Acinetobacter baumannii]